MTKEFCPRCGKKEFEYSFCTNKLKCNCCGYFLVKEDFEKIKKGLKGGEDGKTKKELREERRR